MNYLHHALDYFWLAFGFGFVIFFHELGHFLAAKYCDVKVEQFAVGFGPAIFSWRKGLGFRRGSSNKELEDLRQRDSEGIEKVDLSQISDTEYRLNWVPLGGYVKMLGQDDLRPGMVAEDPRSYTNKTIGQRMLIVSAGVIMNVILAAIGFMIVFRLGYPMPPATVGGTLSRSPAMSAVRADGTRVALQPGDEILSYDGKDTTGDFTKIAPDVALSDEGESIPIRVRHVDGSIETLDITPQKPQGDAHSLLQIGMAMPVELSASTVEELSDYDPAKLRLREPADFFAVKPGDVITQVNGQDVGLRDSWKLSVALANSNGQPVTLTVQSSTGEISHPQVYPHFAPAFGKEDLDFLGLVPRAAVDDILEKSPALAHLQPGDAVVHAEGISDGLTDPSGSQLRKLLTSSGDKKTPVKLDVLDPGATKPRSVEAIIPTMAVDDGKLGLGIGLRTDEDHLVVAEVLPRTSAYGKIPAHATITAVNGSAVKNWFEFRGMIATAKSGDVLKITYLPPDADQPATADVSVTESDIESAREIGFTNDLLLLREMPGILKTTNPITALKLGIIETRDLIEQFYLTLQRMFTGGVSVRNAMGPIGMFQAGTQIAAKGANWLIWYLSMISANLAVVNFLPIPIVDGGLFTMLILEKIQGKPLSPDVQKIIQAVGLALILGVFLLVTWQDIARAAGYLN